MTPEQTQALVRECGLDWHRGYIPLFAGDPTNRYAVLVEATIEKFLNDSGQYLTNDATREAVIAAATDPLLAKIAELEAKLAQRVPDGWKLVPVEPTGAMVLATINTAGNYTPAQILNWPEADEVRVVYNAMVSAAPQQPAQADHPEQDLGMVCPHCDGSGEAPYLSGGGPDAYEVTGPCETCKGTGGVAQPPQQERVPLTIQEVEQINARWNYELHGDRLRFVVREVEAAHNITKGQSHDRL